MRTAFADTCHWVATFSQDDRYRAEAAAIDEDFKHNGGLMVTTKEVLVEFLNSSSRFPLHERHRATLLVDFVQQARHIRVVEQSHESFMAGIALYRRRLDKGYSLVDCISMATMRNEQIADALTADRHFEQEAFKLLY